MSTRQSWKWILILIFVSLTVGYFSYQNGFEVGRDFTAQMDSTNPKKWTNKKWGYEITFPGQWDALKRNDPSIKSMGADVFCSNKAGASTAVFVSPMGNETIDKVTDEILGQYKTLGELIVVDKKDYTKDKFSYRTIIFKQKEVTHHYTFIFTNAIFLMISSNSPNETFDGSKADFEEIVNSVKFFKN